LAYAIPAIDPLFVTFLELTFPNELEPPGLLIVLWGILEARIKSSVED